MMPLIAIATRSHRLMPRTRPSSPSPGLFCTADGYNTSCAHSCDPVNLLLMHIRNLLALGAVILISVSQAVAQQTSWQDLVNHAAKTTVERFAPQKLEEKQLSITLIDMRNPARPVTASFRGNERIYPASVSKLFYLVAAHRWLEDKKIEETPELTRALRDMIVD